MCTCYFGLEFSYPLWTDGIEMADGIGGQIKTCVPLENSCSSKGIWKTFHQKIHGHITADFSSYYPLCCTHLFILPILLQTSLHITHFAADISSYYPLCCRLLFILPTLPQTSLHITHFTADFSSYYALCCRHHFILRTLLLTSPHTNHITGALQKLLKWQNTICG
jgi:hypothetical protein